jgi:exopolysaccharide biosynthesis polyprenyl glycosylphosphotransferase
MRTRDGNQGVRNVVIQLPAVPAPASLPRAATASRTWVRDLALRLSVTDAAAVLLAVAASQVVRFGADGAKVALRDVGDDVSYTGVSALLVVGWLIALTATGTRDERVVGVGNREYVRIVDASLRLFGLLAVIAFLLKIDLARGYVLASLPIGVGLLLLTRWIWRRWLAGRRRAGEFITRVLLVGSAAGVQSVARDLLRSPQSGFVVAGACVPGFTGSELLPGDPIPVWRDGGDVPGLMSAAGADTVIVTGGDAFGPDAVRRLSWALEPGRQHLVVAPSLTDVGGPRIRMRPVAGLPLIHVETPSYDGAKQFAKRAFDVVVAAVMLALAAPLMAVVALAIVLDSRGPVLFTQRRVGFRGERFGMLKFRSMVPDAEARLADLQAGPRDGNVVMFKLRRDPRVTRVGRIIRRVSIDELPQLLNVLSGRMSIVGPRPPIEPELGSYEEHVHRRFLVKPGITGLWQVSGRSELSWDDTVRLDLYYVENWSMTGDLVILWRTAKAVLARTGAY